jgi:hypothetical protein
VRIAVVGSGIAGLATAWLLDRGGHAVTLFEAAPRLGGHANTVTVALNGREVAVDTGFIVFNRRTYPLLSRLFDHLGIATAASSMSFSASIAGGAVEYAGRRSLGALFAQRRNAVRPSFLRMLHDIRRFNQLGWGFLRGEEPDEPSIGGFLDRHGFGRGLCDWYLLPMAAAIWSAPVVQIKDYPARSFLTFFANHGLLGLGRRPAWRTVVGGSRRYVDRLAAGLRPRIRLATPITGVRRRPWGVELRDHAGERHRFDRVVLACHADQSLALLEDATAAERGVLAAFRFQANRAVLHRDPKLMPRRRAAWASWNYLAPGELDPAAKVSATYWMNRLQNLPGPEQLFVTLNPLREPDPRLVHAELDYAHPMFDAAALAAQRRMATIQGLGGLWHAGAWLGHGFHEDGLRSGVAVARALGVELPWLPPHATPAPAAVGLPVAAAAARPA